MSASFDTSAPLATPQRRAELVEAIIGAAVSETHWLEWKSSLDLAVPAGRFAVARTIIAFANRNPAVAARVCGGEAYLVVGVEPGHAAGVTELDPAELHEKLRTFVDGPHWEVSYVDAREVRAAVFTVAAPKPGDRIHSLLKTHEGNRSGTIFYRGVGGSAPATHGELRMLQDRLLHTPRRPPAEEFQDAVGGTNPLVVDRLMRDSVKSLLAARADRDEFPLVFADRGYAEQLAQYLAVSQRYEAVAAPVLEQLIMGCAWPNPSHDRIWCETLTAVAQSTPLLQTVTGQVGAGGVQALMMTQRDPRLEALALLPATLALYAGAIAAVGGCNYAALRALTTDGLVSWSAPHRQRKVTVVEKVGPWETFSRDEDLALAVRAGQLFHDPTVLDEKLSLISSQRQLRKPRFVCSDYLKDALRSSFAGYGPTRYDELFDETEVLLSLIVADRMAQPDPYTQPWLGLFVIGAGEVATLEDSYAGDVLARITSASDKWPPLQDGLFDGEPRRVRAALEYVTDQTLRLRHQRW